MSGGEIMIYKTLLIVIVILLSLGIANAATLNVGKGQTYTTIQSAIDASNTGDEISVGEGTYSENLIIKKNGISIIGKNKEKTVIDGKKIGSVIRIDQTNNVKISGFTIQNSGGSGKEDAGITIYSAKNNMVANTIFLDNIAGISIYSGSSDNIISGNDIRSSANNGIFIFSSSDNKIYNNNIQGNKFGIYADSARKNNIYSNNFMDNKNQAFDNSGLNSWDDGKSGNYWSDSKGSAVYTIPGEGKAKDNYPLSGAVTLKSETIPAPAGQDSAQKDAAKPSPGFAGVVVLALFIMAGVLRNRKK
ncbi:Cell surface glycoprotein [uncultured archaeon]|nr:Cell surface glycoprotein [uncultured archaeon]